MRIVQHTPHPPAGNRSYTPSSFVIAERARREALERAPLLSAVDLAKESGLLYRLHAMLND